MVFLIPFQRCDYRPHTVPLSSCLALYVKRIYLDAKATSSQRCTQINIPTLSLHLAHCVSSCLQISLSLSLPPTLPFTFTLSDPFPHPLLPLAFVPSLLPSSLFPLPFSPSLILIYNTLSLSLTVSYNLPNPVHSFSLLFLSHPPLARLFFPPPFSPLFSPTFHSISLSFTYSFSRLSLLLCLSITSLSPPFPPSLFLSITLLSPFSGLSLVVGLVLYISSINDEVMNRPREPEHFFHYHYGWSFAFAASSFLLKEGAGVMSVYLFMKRYAEEEMYRPHPSLYRPRLSECSDYSGQYLHPESWPPPKRGRSASEVSSDISIQLNQTPPPPKGSSMQQQQAPSSGPSSGASYQPSSSSSSYPHHSMSSHPLHSSHHTMSSHPSGPPPQSMPMAMPPSAQPPPRYHQHMHMSASPC
uniref:Voltage-dependent calcium channel gamma-7 subunit n=1 Tax=Oncorhynchus tshawytscha TaxID=74940 RepID=A0AAZ3NQS4_ONCTS